MPYGIWHISGVNETTQFNPNTGARSIRRGRALTHSTLDLKKSVVTIASHGWEDGIGVDGTRISANAVAEGLKYAANLKALHFSSCSVMKDKFGKEVFNTLADAGVKTAVSGYQNPVDWAASALFEMTYFDLLLSRGMNAPEASATALSIFPIAGKAQIKNVPIAPGGFEILR